MALVTFNESGDVVGVLRFGSERYGARLAIGAEVPAHIWHTVVALEPGSVLLEIKAGPFDPDRPKDLAIWAPEEGTASAGQFLRQLISRIGS